MESSLDINEDLNDNERMSQILSTCDQEFLRNHLTQQKQDKSFHLKKFYRTSTLKTMNESLKHVDYFTEVRDQKYSNILNASFDKVSPLIYLSPTQREGLLKSMKFIKYNEKRVLYSGNEDYNENGDWNAYILIKGEAHIFDNKQNFNDLLNRVVFFGYDGPIFKKRFNTVIIEKKSVIGVISEQDFLHYLQPFSKFCTYISRNIIIKDKVLDELNKLKSYILQSIDHGPLDIEKLITNYKKIHPCLHPKCNFGELDIPAWTYALNRLPNSILETYVLMLVNTPPKILSAREDMAKHIIPRISTNARMRDVFRYLEGKNLIVVREMETDVLDFICNMCIHIIEAQKIRKVISSPLTVSKLFDTRDNFDATLEVLREATGEYISEENAHTLRKIFGIKFAEKLISLCLHYQDYTISIVKISNLSQDPVELWVQNLWNVSKELLGVNSSVDEIDDLVVDIMQGSKRTLLGCISPYLYKHKEEIIKWGVSNEIQLKTKVFLSESDKLLAYSYYYYKTFPEKQKEKDALDREHGIVVIEQTYSTGVQILLININKLDSNYVDPSLKLKPASANHMILHIGYTFGAQSGQLIKPLLMLFGSKARSMNIIGKAGGLAGNRTDILVSSRMFYDKTHELANINYGKLDVEELKEHTKTNIHVGPMLTVAGTILQNNDLLHFYKHVMGCVGLEMEGYFFVREIENSIKHGLLNQNFVTRCFYYVSDLPLDPNQNLANEEGNVSWDEGIGSMNAIQRYILKQIISE